MTRIALTLTAATLLGGCPCGGPFVAVDCIEPGVSWRVVDDQDTLVQPDEVRLYVDDVLTETLSCTPLGSECQFVFQRSQGSATYRAEADLDGVTYTASVTIDADAERSQCCGGFYEQGDVVLPASERPDVCASLDADDCAREPTCDAVFGFPVAEGPCVDWGSPTAVACQTPRADDRTPSLAAPPDDPDACLAFDDAPPVGWLPCDDLIPAACE